MEFSYFETEYENLKEKTKEEQAQLDKEKEDTEIKRQTSSR